MIFVKVLFSVFVILLAYSVSYSNGDNKTVNRQSVTRSARQKYMFNHPPVAESYQAIPVSIVYDDEEIHENKSLEPKLNNTVEKLIVKNNLSETKTTNKFITSTVSYDSNNDIEVKSYRQNKNSNQKEVNQKSNFENVYQIPVAVLYDEPNAEPNTKRNILKSPARERVRGFILRKLDDPFESSQFIVKATTRKPVDSKSHQSTFTTEVQKEHGNRTSEHTKILNPNIETPRDAIKSDQITDTQINNTKNLTSKSEEETTKKVVGTNNNENTASTKLQTIETQKEHGNRTSLKVDTKDILNSRIKLHQKELITHETETKQSPSTNNGSVSMKSDQISESRKDNGNFSTSNVDAKSTKYISENKNIENTDTTIPYIKDIKKENSNRTSSHTREINTSNNQRLADRKQEIKVTGEENSNLQASKTVETENVHMFEKRKRGRDPVVPIIESENRVFSQNGGFRYSYEGGDGTKAFEMGELKKFEDEKTGEAVVGSFSYKDKDGNDYSLSYTADENGYRPVGAHLPTPPPIPPAIARALRYLATKPTPDPETATNYYRDY